MEYALNGVSINYANYYYGNTHRTSDLRKVLISHLHIAKDCSLHDCLHYNAIGANYYRVDKYKTYNKSGSIETNYFDDGQFIMNDGTLVMIENAVNNFILITVDINGLEKGPNIWGHDLFSFQLTDNGLIPSGAENTAYDLKTHPQYCSKTSNVKINGIACTYEALNNSDYWKNLP